MLIRLSTIFSLVTLCGCMPSAPGTVRGNRDRSASFNHAGEGAVPGLDAGTISAITMLAGPPEGVSFVVWSDLTSSSGGGGGSSFGANYDGEHLANDGRQITIQAETSDGVSGTLTIDTTTYDLGEGALFLVSTQAGEATVIQIDVDTTDFPLERDELMKVAEENPQIGEFFRSEMVSESDDSETPDNAGES